MAILKEDAFLNENNANKKYILLSQYMSLVIVFGQMCQIRKKRVNAIKTSFNL
jgi:hypothetical protein